VAGIGFCPVWLGWFTCKWVTLSAILGVRVLRLSAGQVESLWDEVLPIEVRELPEDLARIDALLGDPGLLAPIAAHWQAEADASGRSAVGHGRPTIAMATYVRMMIVKQRSGWGYETLVREVSDSLHLRRFCLIGIDRRVPDESTVRKLTRRLGAEAVNEITRLVIAKAQHETRFVGRAVRVDSTVIEADIRYPSDAMLALQGTRALAREGGKLRAMVKGSAGKVRDRSRSVGRTVRKISKTLARRTGEAKAQVTELNSRAGAQIARSAREARRLAAQARRAARGRGAKAKLRAAARLEQLAGRCEKIAEQISRRARGLKITDRLVSISDADARPIRKGKLGKMTEFGYVAQIAEVTPNTRRGGARVRAAGRHRAGQPDREPATAHDHGRARPAGDPAARAGRRRRLRPRPDQRSDAARHPAVPLRPPPARLTAHPQAPSALPHRLRGPHQPPQAPLRATPQPAEGP